VDAEVCWWQTNCLNHPQSCKNKNGWTTNLCVIGSECETVVTGSGWMGVWDGEVRGGEEMEMEE